MSQPSSRTSPAALQRGQERTGAPSAELAQQVEAFNVSHRDAIAKLAGDIDKRNDDARKAWDDKLGVYMTSYVYKGLVDRRLIEEQRRKFLWLIPYRTYVHTPAGLVDQLPLDHRPRPANAAGADMAWFATGRDRAATGRLGHRPGLDTPVAVKALFQRHGLDKIVDGDIARLFDETINLDRPGPGLQAVGEGGKQVAD